MDQLAVMRAIDGGRAAAEGGDIRRCRSLARSIARCLLALSRPLLVLLLLLVGPILQPRPLSLAPTTITMTATATAASATCSISRAQLLSVFRHSIHLARRLPRTADVAPTLDTIRQQFRSLQHEQDAERVTQTFHEVQSRLRFLKMRTTRLDHRRSTLDGTDSATERSGSSSVYTYDKEQGTVIEERARLRGFQGYKDKRIDPADLKRHEKLLRRQHFIYD